MKAGKGEIYLFLLKNLPCLNGKALMSRCLICWWWEGSEGELSDGPGSCLL